MGTSEKKEHSPLHTNNETQAGGAAIFHNGNHCDVEEPTFVKRRRRTNWIRVLTCCSIVLVCLLIMFVILYTQEKDQRRDYEKKLNNTSTDTAAGPLDGKCKTPECVIIASRMIESMDTSIDPCDDFYQYSCGGWLKSTPIPDSRRRYSRFEKLDAENSMVLKSILNDLGKQKTGFSTPVLRDAATYYSSCMDTNMIEKIGDNPMKDLIKQMGSWPVTDPTFNETAWDVMLALVNVHKNISQAPLFNIYVNPDIKNSTENILVFDQSGIILDRDSYLKNTSYHQNRREAYRRLMVKIVSEMGADENGIKLMDQVFQFEKQLAQIHMSLVDRRDYNVIYKKMTLDQLCNKTQIPKQWLMKFVNYLFEQTGKTVPITETVVSFNTEYVRDAFKLFIKLDKKTQASYIMWHAVHTMAPIVLGKYQDIFDDYYMSKYGIKDRQPRWEICIGDTLSAFGHALARPFVDKVYDKTAKDMSTEMIKAIKYVFTENLESMDWMDEKTKSYARRKAEHILENIGYPDYIMNNTALEAKYKDMITLEGQHFANYMRKRKTNNLNNYAKRGKPVDKSEWGVLPTTVNAYYAPTENKIGFPAAILQWPFYDKRAPRAVSYGGIGMVVGHEISHGFDDQGKEFTIEGNMESWWTNESTHQFKKRTKCFIDQYSNFEMFGKKSNGKQTLGEDLADNGGLQQALKAYKAWVAVNGKEDGLPGLDLSAEQLFYLAFSQVWCTAYRQSAAQNQIENGLHSLSNFRVIGTLQNNPEFSRVYKCPVGSRMNPKKKCKIW